ncbi:YaiO family outer membrane beta-barrel protein [Gillisia sp. JM1]|uniref:YaiO family outer membrane beta-barrel protein n=1 Tax=Gillisia sp. JM1 TaxID=1283286 RepID=UPI00041DCDB8|nr:YaiO family outer membrane beta-barrel protein [Gillisia sp. JM1]
MFTQLIKITLKAPLVIYHLPNLVAGKIKFYPPFSLLLFFLIITTSLNAQDTLSSDELFINARTAAFDEDDYPKAIRITKKALEISPNYSDIRIFLGRLYTWTDEVGLARKEFDRVIETDPGYEDAHLAYGYLEYWNDNPKKALIVIEPGIEKNPDSKGLLMLKAKIQNNLEEFAEANKTLEELLVFHPKDSEARAFSQKIKDLSSKNQIGVDYDFVYFDERFSDPWHLASVSYGRQTPIGSVTGRLNYANRFTTNGVQFEVDAYPRISDTFYAYVSGGISENGGIFPRYRAGFSLYANLPKSFEADLGFRFLSFSRSTWIYTASIGKYYSNYWFNLRTYLTPSNISLSKSISLSVRYYLAGADDYLSLRIGTGLSPDRPENYILLDENNKVIGSLDQENLESSNISLGYRKSIKQTNILSIDVGAENQEYALDKKGYQFTVGAGFTKRF